MKRIGIAILLLTMIVQISIAQSDIDDMLTDSIERLSNRSEDDRHGAHPWKPSDKLAEKYARWSLSVDAGFDFFSGDMRHQGVDIISSSRVRPYGGFFINCDFTPVLGLGIGYTYANYGAKRTIDDWLVYGHLHSLEAVFTVDLVDAWNFRRETTVCSWYLLAGGGAGYYASTFNDGVNPPITSAPDGAYSWCGFATVGTLLEFNVSRSIALGLKAEYHINMTDNLDAKVYGSTNDHMLLGSLQLRWKIGAARRNHMRNISTSTQHYLEGDKARGRRGGSGGADSLSNRDTLVVTGTDTLYLTRETERIIERHRIESIKLINNKSAAYDQRFNVYFAPDKDNLDRFALQEIQKVASILEEDNQLCVTITGYSDNTASQGHNAALSKRRANKVRNELVNVYKISQERVVSMGLGIIRNTSASYSPNRRVELRIVSQDDLGKIQSQKDSLENLYNTQEIEKTPIIKNSKRNDDILPKLTDISMEEKVDTLLEKKVETITPQVKTTPKSNATAVKPLAKITVDDTTTLIQLAKTYYDDGDYWPFIYEANKSLITYPTRLKKGTILTIPRLTERQKKMSKKALEQLANKYLQ